MSLSFHACNYREWSAYNLADYSDYCDKITEYNMIENGDDSTSGQWYYIPEEILNVEGQGKFRVIYYGTWGNYNSPGASHYTHAELYDVEDELEMEEFAKHSEELLNSEEWLEQE